jgi:uncharacterized membrane protein
MSNADIYSRIGTENWQKLTTLSQAVNSLLFGVSVVAAILALLSLLRVTVFILEISGEAFSIPLSYES